MKAATRMMLGLALLLALGAGGLQAQAQDKDWSISIDNNFTSKYIWRGQDLANTPSMQPGFTYSYKGLSLSSWSNFAHTEIGDSGVLGNHWTEHDFTVDYGLNPSEKVSVNFGFINYAFPNLTEGRYTNEIYGSVGFDTILQPTFAVYGDMHNGDGMYYNFGIGHGVDLGKGVALNLSAAVGLNQKQWIDITTVSDVVLGVSVDIPLGMVTFSPFYNYITGNKSLRTCDGCFYYTGSIAGMALNISY